MAWLALPHAAAARLSYPHDAEVLAGLKPRATVPLILARHVSAGSKDDWPGEDLVRPLDAEGAVDALLLADLLACFALAPGSSARPPSGAWTACGRTPRPSAGRSRLTPP